MEVETVDDVASVGTIKGAGELRANCKVEEGRGGLGHAATLRFPSPLISRVEDWRAGVGRSLCSLLSRPFVCECHIISTMPGITVTLNRRMRFGTSAWIRGSSPRMTVLYVVTDIETPLDIHPHFRYKPQISLIEGRLSRGCFRKRSERGSCGRSEHSAPGRSGHRPRRHDDRRARCLA